ncbi:MAG: extracellular solute-binding protein [Candidatus Gracilibacteria bacterium]|nr:extracellular solute-binding protein [Candidatus Gracilibacteria bacterium]
MSKNKIILIIIAGVFLLFFIWVILNLNTQGADKNKNEGTNGAYSVWLYQDNAQDMGKFFSEFKKNNPQYSGTTFSVESFSDYEDYIFTLQSAFAQGKAPDLFMLNNSESTPLLEEYTAGINPDIINPNDFRKKFQDVFSEDLISTVIIGEGEEAKEVEFLKGIPIGYETLGIYYNKKKQITASDFYSMSSFNSKVSILSKRYSRDVPLALGNGSMVMNVSDVITQFFLLGNNITSIKDISKSMMGESLLRYMSYGDIDQENGYNALFADMIDFQKQPLDMFVKNKVFMVMGYPRMLFDIEKKGFSPTALAVEPFPFDNNATGNTLVNYNYFVKNTLSQRKTLSDDLLQYMSSDMGATSYFKIFPYYFSALNSLDAELRESKIMNKYKNITLGDFYNKNHPIQTVDIGIKTLYDREIVEIGDDTSDYIERFETLQSTILCKAKKYKTLENLSTSCN